MSTQKSELVSDTATLVRKQEPVASVAACAPALPASDQQITSAMMAEMRPLVRMHNDWPGWPGSWAFAAAALRVIKRVLLAAEPQPVKRLERELIDEIDRATDDLEVESSGAMEFARAIETACAAAWGVKLED